MSASVFCHPFLGDLFGDVEIENAWSPARQLAHMLDFERALSRALAAAGQIDNAALDAVLRRMDAFQPDMARLKRATARDGVVVPELVRQLRAGLGEKAALHTGATSQDVIDTALVLTLGEIAHIICARLERLLAGLDGLSARHGAARIMGRTRMQAAMPIAARHRITAWSAPLRHHLESGKRICTSLACLQLGGATGDRAAFGAHSAALARQMADDLGLGEPGAAWHTQRAQIVEFGNWLALVSGSLGKTGQDICLMAQQGIDEIVLEGGGRSSAMAHKNNPVDAELLVCLARYNGAQTSALNGALLCEQERSGSAWMLEWMCLPPMTIATGRAVRAATGLVSRVVRLGSPGTKDAQGFASTKDA